MVSRREFLTGGAAVTVTAAAKWPDSRRRSGRRLPVTGLHLDGVPQTGTTPLVGVERAVGRLDVVHWFQAWGAGHGPYEPAWFDTVARTGRTGLLSWEPWALPAGGDWAPWLPARIAAGDHDRYIDEWAARLAARRDGPWWLRPMHEMNGNWYPWGGGDPAEYQAAWRRIVDRFDRAGAGRRVRWLWAPLVDDVAGQFEPYYPGDRYVDAVGLDGYNWGADEPANGGWRTPAQVFEPALDRLGRLAPSKRVWLTEVGCSPVGGDKPAWVADLYAMARRWPVDAVVWFGLDKEQDWRVHADPAVAAAVRRNR
jgi:mannan endo-1,4-beta-mannosidase